jgi:hypothetical protein
VVFEILVYLYNRTRTYFTTNQWAALCAAHDLALKKPKSHVLVDIALDNWNQLHDWIFKASEAILGLKGVEST